MGFSEALIRRQKIPLLGAHGVFRYNRLHPVFHAAAASSRYPGRHQPAFGRTQPYNLGRGNCLSAAARSQILRQGGFHAAVYKAVQKEARKRAKALPGRRLCAVACPAGHRSLRAAVDASAAVYDSIETLVVNIPDYAATVVDWVEERLINMPELEGAAVSILSRVSESLTNWFSNSILPQMESILTNVTTGVYKVVRAIANLLIGLVVSLYLMYNTGKFTAGCKRILYSLFAPKRALSILKAVRYADNAFMGFISGKLIDSLIIGVMCYIGCLILKMPYAILVSVIVGVTNIIPFFGPIIGAVPSAFLILMVSPVKCLIFVIFVFLLQQFDGNILGPKILGNAVGIKGFWIMFAIIIGGGLFGFIGMVLGVPVMTIILAGTHYLVNAALARRGLSTESEDYEDLDYIDPSTGEMVPLEDSKKAAPTDNDTGEGGSEAGL